MGGRKDSHMPACTLPSFHDLCQSILSSNHDSIASISSDEYSQFHQQSSINFVPPTPTNSLTPSPSCYASMGWFDPTTDRFAATVRFVEGFTLDELFDALFVVDPSRPLYAGQAKTKKISAAKASLTVEQNGLSRKRGQTESHMINERHRRDLHFEFQVLLHAYTPEVAHQLAEQDKQMLEETKKSSGSKGPGKHDQFISDIYMHILSGIVAQSEHNARKAAERRVEELEWQLHELRLKVGINDALHYRDGSLSPSKKRRTFDVSEGINSDWKGKSLLLLPSLTPSLASPRPRL